MPRRLAVAGFAAALAFPALAQTSAPPIPVTPQPAESQPNEGLGSGIQQREQRVHQGGAPQDTQARGAQGSATAAGQQSQADRDYVSHMLAAGTVSLQASNFALTKASDPRVKQFANFEVAEQNTLAEVMHSLAEPTATSATSAGARQAASTAPNLPAEDAQAMERLSKAQAGAAFDTDYVAMQMKGHRDLLAIQETYLKAQSGNRELTNVAKLTRGQIQEHIALLEGIRKEAGR